MSDDLQIIGAPRSHDTLVRVLREAAPCRVLDAPAGTGVLARLLRDLGWEVHCADIDPGNFHLDGVPFVEADLNRGLPHADEEFDAVVCANGLHRLYNPGGAVREFHRVLRPGGRLYVNFNNYASIDRRLRFLLYGSIDNQINSAACVQTIAEPQAHVRITLHVPQVVNQLEGAGFEVLSIRPAAVKPKHRMLAPVAWLVRLLSWLIPPASRRRNRIRWTRTAGVIPGGRYLLIEALKR
jgi:SAM-dependent methyltransferase